MASKAEAETQPEYGPSHGGGYPTSGRNQATRIMTPIRARQGVVSGRVVTVLGISVTLAVVGMVLAFVLT
jgi:hypothetical protein